MAIQLTTDLKPGVACKNLPPPIIYRFNHIREKRLIKNLYCPAAEAERIRKCNGRVLALKEEPHIQRVWLPYDDSPGLAMSRAFGDFVLKRHGIICIPDVTCHRLNPNDKLLVLASDGVGAESSSSYTIIFFEFLEDFSFCLFDFRCGMC